MSESSAAAQPSTRWQRIEQLFMEALQLPQSQWEQFVRGACADDLALGNEVLGMLAVDRSKPGGPLTHALGSALDDTAREKREALIGTTVGNYRVVSVLGNGGTGTVYLGERADQQYAAKVAIKVVDSAGVHPDLGMRFRAERQILANLNHPNIARLIDAGETANRQPYLVMEYVQGKPLDRYCDEHQLDLNARLKLFLDVCAAVEYAHQNLVVHRDLKPANILVTADGTVKLLDFGIAKLLDNSAAAAALALTRVTDRLLTPEYASPEQILGRPVTTTSDVYALGIVLYELLCGLRPYDVPASASQLELERLVCSSDPTRPSTAVRRTIETGPVEGQSDIHAVAAARTLTAERLHRRLLGDLDAIVMRALRKEVQHRYASVEQLAADIQRYLNREPVLARQGNWAYYAQRFARRHTFGVVVSIAAAAFLTTFAIVVYVQNQSIAAERDRVAQQSARAEAVSEFMQDVFSAADPHTTQGVEITARELLDAAEQRIRDDLTTQPEVRVRLLQAIGNAYLGQGAFDRAVTLNFEALSLQRQLDDSGKSVQLASVLGNLADAQQRQGDLDTALKNCMEALKILRELRREESAEFASLLRLSGRLKLRLGDYPGSEQQFSRSLEVMRRVYGNTHVNVAELMLDIANTKEWRGDYAGAEAAARRALEIHETLRMHRHPDTALSNYHLGIALAHRGLINDAATHLERALVMQQELFGKSNSRLPMTLRELARVRNEQGRIAEAETLMREAVQIQERVRPNHYFVGHYRTSLATVLLQQHRHKEAEQEIRAAIATLRSSLPADHQYIASAEHVLGEVLLEQGRLEESHRSFEDAIDRWRRTNAVGWRIARSENALGEVLNRLNRSAEAETLLVDSYRVLVKEPGVDATVRRIARERLEKFYTARGERKKLEELLAAIEQSTHPAQQASAAH